LAALLRERLVWCGLLACGLVAASAAVLNSGAVEYRSMELQRRSRFFTQKTAWEHEFDCVLLGNSRIYRGLSPSEMKKVLPDYRIVNLGFSSGGLNPAIYELADDALAEGGPRKVVVLGVEGIVLHEWAMENECYLSYRQVGEGDRWVMLTFGGILEKFSPVTIGELRVILGLKRGGPPPQTREVYYPRTGWCASESLVSDLIEKKIEKLRTSDTRHGPVADAAVRELLKQVRTWHDRGVLVVGFRPPIHPERRELEDNLSHYAEAELVEQFQAAGGVWLTVDPADYPTYDSSHLNKATARRFSRDLAQAIAERLGASPAP
jgi:hypothetical protein